jgi:hypothetical protein
MVINSVNNNFNLNDRGLLEGTDRIQLVRDTSVRILGTDRIFRSFKATFPGRTSQVPYYAADLVLLKAKFR